MKIFKAGLALAAFLSLTLTANEAWSGATYYGAACNATSDCSGNLSCSRQLNLKKACVCPKVSDAAYKLIEGCTIKMPGNSSKCLKTGARAECYGEGVPKRKVWN